MHRMLKDMRCFLSKEDERREAAVDKKKAKLEISESEDEEERFGGGLELFVARPNPLEPQPKKIKLVKNKPDIKDISAKERKK